MQIDSRVVDQGALRRKYDEGEIQRFYVNMTIKSMTNSKVVNTMPSTIEFLVLPKGSDVTALRIPTTLGDEAWKIQYICGTQGFHSSLHKFYSGYHRNLTASFDTEYPYFNVSTPTSSL